MPQVYLRASLIRRVFVFALLTVSFSAHAQRLPPDAAKASSLLNEALKKSPNYPSLKAFFRTLYNQKLTSEVTFKLPDGTEVRHQRLGLGKDERVVLVNGETTSVLFSTSNSARNDSFHIVNITLIGRHIVFALTRHGSIDNCDIVVIDPKNESAPTILKATKIDFKAIGDDKFSYKRFDVEIPGLYQIYDLSTKTSLPYEELPTLEGGWLKTTSGSEWKLSNTKGLEIPLPDVALEKVFGEVPSGVVISSLAESGDTQLEIVSLPTPEKPSTISTLRKADGSTVKDVVIDGDMAIVTLQRAGRDRLEFLNTTDHTTKVVDSPACCRIVGVSMDSSNQKLSVFLDSTLTVEVLTYDLISDKWERADIEDAMMTKESVSLKSEIVEVPSKDGTLIPMRLTYRRDLVPDGKRPTLIEVYGGFNTEGSIYSNLRTIELEFVKRGGIYAAPALRGGNELGRAWHMGAYKQSKANTMEDLIACARWLSKSWTHPKMIATTGSSNGGMVVASAALLAPDAFGLVIPVAGVHDLLKKEVLDPLFDEGWRYEYGDSRVEEERAWLAPLSPVELAKSGKMPNFLIIAGRNDTRVNVTHSDHLYEALLSHKPADRFVQMLQVKNSGHWILGEKYQGLIAWRANVVMWTVLFDYYGLTF